MDKGGHPRISCSSGVGCSFTGPFSYTDGKGKHFMNCDVSLMGLPFVVQPNGLNIKRQWYLHQFVSDENKYTVAPLPSVPKPGTVTAFHLNVDAVEVEASVDPIKLSNGKHK